MSKLLTVEKGIFPASRSEDVEEERYVTSRLVFGFALTNLTSVDCSTSLARVLNACYI